MWLAGYFAFQVISMVLLMSVILDVFCFSEKQKLAFKELEKITYGDLLRADCLRFYYAKEI